MRANEVKNEKIKIRWGILGTGKIARDFASALVAIPQAQLVSIGSRSKQNALSFGREFGIDPIRCYSSYEELVNDSEIQVVYIATPHTLHAENSVMCLNAGKNVLCEKPFAMNGREAREVLNLARQKKLFIMEAMWTRFLPAILDAKRIIDSGEIGIVKHIQSDFCFKGDANPGHRLNNKDLGGGALLDIGVYCLSIATFFLGAVYEVKAMSKMGVAEVDEQTVFLLKHRSGATSSNMCSTYVSTNSSMDIIGDLGILSIPNRFYRADRLSIMLNNGNNAIREYSLQGKGYAHEALEVIRCLSEGKTESPLMSHIEMQAQTDVLDTIRKQIGLAYLSDDLSLHDV